MGMAASQARFLTLTARKSNTEYQGQQVNQQRTALANESANIYSKLANMDVPTAPSKTSFNRDMYSFKGENNEKYTITNLRNLVEEKDSSGKPTGNYVGTATVDYNEIRQYAQGLTLGDFTKSAGGIISITGKNTYYEVQDCGTGDNKITIDKAIISKYAKDRGIDEKTLSAGNFKYLKPVDAEGKNAAGAGYYVHANDLAEGTKGASVLKYTMESTSSPTSKDVNVTITKNEQGRYTNISLADEHGFNITGNDANLSYEYGTDEDAYEKAMADYEYKKAQYDKEVDVLNNKTEVIQNQDKRLELKLKQLDTERNALNTEMEAVKGYLKKNVEGTFNTFG